MSIGMNDRIKLAEAMGQPIKDSVMYFGHKFTLFDPFTDANDDYAVLEWMRGRKEDLSDPEWGADWYKFSKEIGYGCWYKIGDYARAALKVIE